ncbi:MFS general substrate transporter [Lactarius akahatsu]|uniref:MFS general substrate transporter n=1 Tax=Lactarius akahatsu TaxID=416441 RepID=A0AAD4Q428_9AGAM|nr:MFS general substrate transporter [Lactarius akahatsu]
MSDHDQNKVESAPVTSASHEGEPFTFRHITERRIWQKPDTHLLPLLIFLYFLSFLDRTIIGKPFMSPRYEMSYAAIAGMKEDLRLTGLRYNVAAALFYIPYFLVEVPSNILLRVFNLSRWSSKLLFCFLNHNASNLVPQVPSIMVAWGTVTTLMCLVNSYQGLVIARFFLGLTEGGLFPGLAYYISLWYPRQLQAKRIALLISIATVGGAFGGIFAYGIEHLEGKAGLRGWQWIFFVEGLSGLAFIHDIMEEERQSVIQTLANDSKGQATHFSTKFVWQALADRKTYAQAANFMCVYITGVAVALFTPTIVHDLGFSATHAQLLSVPPFLLAGVSTYIISIWSDRANLRGPFIVICAMVSMTGYITAYATSKPGPGYAAAIIAACGAFPCIAITLAWAAGNAGGIVKRGIVLAVVIGLGNIGGVCSSFIYYQPPRFYKGHGTMIGCLGVSSIMTWTYKRLNKEKEEQCAREGIHESMKDVYRDLADKSPLFRSCSYVM